MTAADRGLSSGRGDLAAASSEPRTKGHISTLHLWRARRRWLRAGGRVLGFRARAATPEGREEQSQFLKNLCRWEASSDLIRQARERIRAARVVPRVLDLLLRRRYSLEALRLGVKVRARPESVAYLIEKQLLSILSVSEGR